MTNFAPQVKIFRHKIGSKEKDLLIYSEDDDRFFVSLYLTSDYKYYILTSSDHATTEQYFFASNEEHPKAKLVHSREAEVKYSIDSWQNYFYLHTNKGAKDYKICRTKNKSFEKFANWYFENQLLGYSYTHTLRDVFKNEVIR